MCADDVVVAALTALRRGQLFCMPGCTNRLMMTLGQIGLVAVLAKPLVRRSPARTAELPTTAPIAPDRGM